MKKVCLSVCFGLMLVATSVFAQQPLPSITEMKWGYDYNLHVKLSNDTNYVMDVRALYHTGSSVFDTSSQSATYYPVSLDEDFINHLKSSKLQADSLSARSDSAQKRSTETLWSALHKEIGSGYIHFVNCVVYSLESRQLNLEDPIMKRPVTNWKPKPMTESYKRTKKWVYYIPYTQSEAQKEYKKRLKENDLRDLQGVPDRFVTLFNETSQKQYETLKAEGKWHLVAQIDLIKLLLGAKYLGRDQISFISSRVIASVLRYNASNLPTVIIFDDYNAAVAMTLDASGYKIDYVVFKDADNIVDTDKSFRLQKIESLIKSINEANDKVFRKRLSTYYQSSKKS